MEEKTIRSISPVPLGLIAGAVSALAGLMGTILLAIFYLPYTYTLSETFNPVPGTPTPTILPTAMAILVMIAIPIVAFVVGFIQGFLSAVIYNFLAPRIGGIKIRLEETNKTSY